MNAQMQKLCTWSGLAFIAMFAIGWVFIAWFIPPHEPTWTAAQVAEIYRQNTTAIRLGQMLLMVGCGFLLPWVAVISIQMRRIEGAHPVLAYIQLASAAVAIVFLILPAMLWTAAAFRPERDPEIILALNDVAWLLLTMVLSPAFFQVLSIGIAILLDGAAQPVFPRWAGYLNIWIAVLFLPAALITFFKTGPFAWNGVLAFWLPAAVFFLWFFVMLPLLLKAIGQQTRSH